MDLSQPHTWQWVWLVAMVVLGVGEMAMAGSFFLAPFALGAAVAAILAFAGVGIGIQWTAFLAVSIVSFLAMRPLARRLDQRRVPRGIGANRLVGQHGRVTEEIGTSPNPGMIAFGAEQWRAESIDGRPIGVDTSVVITEVRGTRVIVRTHEAPTEAPTESPT